jgi:hypothetical protein
MDQNDNPTTSTPYRRKLTCVGEGLYSYLQLDKTEHFAARVEHQKGDWGRQKGSGVFY